MLRPRFFFPFFFFFFRMNTFQAKLQYRNTIDCYLRYSCNEHATTSVQPSACISFARHWLPLHCIHKNRPIWLHEEIALFLFMIIEKTEVDLRYILTKRNSCIPCANTGNDEAINDRDCENRYACIYV